MDIRFKLKPVSMAMGYKRAGIVEIIEHGHSPLTSDIGSPLVRQDHTNWLVRVYVLQKFNTKYKNTVNTEFSTHTKKVIDSVLIRRSYWQAKIYEIDLRVLNALDLQLIQHARHFTVCNRDVKPSIVDSITEENF